MKKPNRTWIVVLAIVGAAGGAGAQPTGSGSANPVESMAGDAGTLRKTCVSAMNQDPSFAESIIKKAEIQLSVKVNSGQVQKDLCTIELHTDAQNQIATNERHVILAYAAMWLVAAGLVLFLWRRQQALKTELAQLRRDLDAATKDAT